jgi:IPT/TIG domain
VFGLNFGSHVVPTATQTLGEALNSVFRNITVGSSLCVPTFWNDSLVVCAVGSGVAADVAVVVSVSGLKNVAVPGLLGYLPPSLGMSSPHNGTTSGGTTIVFSGSNFGPSSSPLTVNIVGWSPSRSYPCVVSVSVDV